MKCLLKKTGILDKPTCTPTDRFDRVAREKWVGKKKLFTNTLIENIAVQSFVQENSKELEIKEFIFNTCVTLNGHFKGGEDIKEFAIEQNYCTDDKEPFISGVLVGLASIVEYEAKRKRVFKRKANRFVLSEKYSNSIISKV